MKEEVIYEKLLKNLEDDDSKFSPQNMKNSERAKYYYKNIEDNMFNKKIHNKLDSRARAIYSSAAMIYNLLGDKVKIKDKVYEVQYEEELEAIIPGEGRYETHKAHLDASLRNDKEIIFCEAKMKEWLGRPKKLAEAYLNEKCYLNITDNKEEFINFFNKIIDKKSLSKGRYNSIYERYDAIQMTIHTLGIYNFVKGKKNGNVNKITLLNCVWGYDEIPEYQIEKKEAMEYIDIANKEFKKIFANIGVDFSIEYLSFHELENLIDFTGDEERKKYLKRYDIESSLL